MKHRRPQLAPVLCHLNSARPSVDRMPRPRLSSIPRPHLFGPSRRSRWRRWVLRRGAAAACAVAAVVMVVPLVRPPASPTTEVLVAARDLPTGAVLTSSDLRVGRVAGGPDAAGAVGGVRNSRDLVGRRLTSGMQSGEVITRGRIVPRTAAEGLPLDTVAAHVLHADEGSLDLVSAGQRVTLFAATGGEALARDVLVLGVDTPESPSLTRSLPVSQDTIRGFVVALPPADLDRVFAGQRPEGGPPQVLTVITP